MSKSKIISVVAIIVGLIAVIAVIWYRTELIKPASKNSQAFAFEIKEGTASKIIANNLKEAGVIRSPLLFLTYVKLQGVALQAGFYTLDPQQSIIDIVSVIAKGKVSEYQVTIPEGWRSEQIAQLLEKEKIVSFEDFMKAAKGKEGRLFPDTYRLGLKITPEDIVAKMEKNYDRRLKDAGLTNVSDADLVLASIVEREAKHDEDRSKMAGVYKNRLAINMALEADPGTQYGIDSDAFLKLRVDELTSYEFWKPITSGQNKNFESPYNIYRHRGLPPTPIANPGIKSIKAALNPEKHNFYFFFNLEDGTTIYSKTRQEHDTNRKKYGI